MPPPAVFAMPEVMTCEPPPYWHGGAKDSIRHALGADETRHRAKRSPLSASSMTFLWLRDGHGVRERFRGFEAVDRGITVYQL